MIYWGEEVPDGARFSLHPFLPGPPVALGALRCRLSKPTPPIAVLEKHCLPNFPEWETEIKRALATDSLKKVVLARKTTLKLAKTPDPWAIAAALQKRTLGATVFCAALPDASFLLGATPERLFKKVGHQIQVEALAGTRPLGQEKELLKSAKDHLEFRLVEEHFQKKLAPFTASPVVFSALQLHKTATLHHLKSIGTATLKPGVSEHQLIAALHPSPALLGTPSDAALAFLQQHEPFQRGFYGGLIGWSVGDACDWKVVIRCCHLEGSTAHLYAGTGIVQGSDAEEEWNELETKQALYNEVFSCNSSLINSCNKASSIFSSPQDLATRR